MGNAPGDHYVYIIATMTSGAPDSPVKVGITKNLIGRLGNLQTASATELMLFHYFPVPERWMAEYLERMFHDTQDEYRLKGEWFDLHPIPTLQLMCMAIRTVISQECKHMTAEERAMLLRLHRVIDGENKLRTIGAVVPGDQMG